MNTRGRGSGGGARRGACLLAATFAVAGARAEEVVRNWFNDPFFQVRSAIADCPMPLGPYGNEEHRMRETHYRLERGLRCYLEKKCSKPSSYMYDADIASAVRARFEASPRLRDASLWVTVQRRFAWVEGCVASSRGQGEIEALLHGIPDLERVIVFVSRDRRSPLPYPTLQPGQRRDDASPQPNLY
jgi:hypothetical protein